MDSFTKLLPAKKEVGTKEVCAPFKIRTFLSLYGWWSFVNTTGSPASLNGSSFFNASKSLSLSITHKPKISAVSINSST